MAWIVQTLEGEEPVITALTDSSYTRLCLTLQSEVQVPVVPLWEDLNLNCIAFAVPAELIPWIEPHLSVVQEDGDCYTEAQDGFCVAVAVVVVGAPAMTFFHLAPAHVSFTTNGRWPHAGAVLEFPGEATREPPPDDFEGVAPSPISRTPLELDVLLGAHLFNGHWQDCKHLSFA